MVQEALVVLEALVVQEALVELEALVVPEVLVAQEALEVPEALDQQEVHGFNFWILHSQILLNCHKILDIE